MITCVYMGGLGNQLFEIFALIGYSLKYRDSFILPYIPNVGNRPTYWDTFLTSLKIFTTYNAKYNITAEQLNSIPPEVNCLQHHYVELSEYPNSKITKLYGYFQSYKYFHEYRDKIFKMIRLESQQNDICTQYSNYFANSGRTPYYVSMHFRFGDYKNLQEYHHLLDSKYYMNAMKYVKSVCNCSDIIVLYFCEMEDNYIVNNIIDKVRTIDASIEFVKVDDSIEDWKQLLLMSCCHSNIIANSTYSWWGAYFNRNSQNHVCYPDKWFGPMNSHLNIGDMFLPSWKKIEA